MTTYAFPSEFYPRTCSIYLDPNTRGFTSPYSRAYNGVDLLGERFRMTLGMRAMRNALAGRCEAYFNRLRGVHYLSAWHFARPQPRGTMRGTPTLSNAVAQGASSLPIMNALAGETLEPGDMIGVSGELFQVADAMTFNGSGQGTVNVVNRVRPLGGLAVGSAVIWDRPTAVWRLPTPVALRYEPSAGGPVSQPFDVELIQV